MQRTPLKALVVCRGCGEVMDPAWDQSVTAYVGRLGVRGLTHQEALFETIDGKPRK